ncbi:MAG TPA: ATP-binding protein, partial [Candidatus Saccharimonadales bacterium]|nr:ATP-binding protein [Candidatus Saccharimonadales bacterium]
EFAETLGDIEEGLSRVKTIVSDLRTFTHPGERGAEPVVVQDAVQAALRFLSQEWRDKVIVRTKFATDLVVLGDKNRFIQLLINLLQNSLDALRHKTFTGEEPSIEITGRVENGQTRITVRDNGEGIERGVLDKIFDPFFTTKDVGQGMGLGLSICYRIVQDFGGRIAVASEHGRYSEFTLEFPEEEPRAALHP